jgi:hypothetical protein
MIISGRARSSKDRAAAFEAVRWEFESLRAYTPKERNLFFRCFSEIIEKNLYSIVMTARRLLPLLLLALLLPAGDRDIRIEFPNGGEVLKSGGEVRVLWKSLGISGDLAILLFKGGEQYAVIAAAAPDCGFYQWKISAALPDSGQYRLRICSLRDLRINDFSDRDFTIKK